MPEFSCTVRVEPPVEPAMVDAFSDLLAPLQSAMVRIAHEHSKLKEKCEELEKENGRLRMTNQGLQHDVDRLSSELAGRGVAAPPPAATPPAAGTAGKGGRLPAAPAEDAVFELVRKMNVHQAPVHSVTMEPEGRDRQTSDIVATASWDATVKLVSLTQGSVVQTMHEDEVLGKMAGLYSVAFAKTNPEILGCTSCDKSVYLWNHRTGRMLKKLTEHKNEVNGIDFHEAQQVMVTASDDYKAIIWDFQEGLQLRTLECHKKEVYGATFLDGADLQYLVATCCFDKITRVFDMRDKKVTQSLLQHTDDVIGINYSPASMCLATGSDDGFVCLWDIRTWKLQQKIDTKQASGISENEVKRVAFSPNGDALAAACSSGKVLVFDVTTFPARPLATLGGHTDCVFDVAWGVCPRTHSTLLVSASHDNSCSCWRKVA